MLGFGTAPILGRQDRRTSERAIALALKLGIRHFDTARSYGWGEAEAVLGRAIRHVARDDLFIVSKCGIVPVRRTRGLGLLKSLARRIVATLPGLAGPLRRVASTAAFQPSRSYDVGVLRDSLATSLRELNVDYLDVLLLHNFELGTEGIEQVVAWFRDERRRGTIRRHGFAIGDRLVESLDWLEGKGLLDDAVIQTPLTAELLALPARHAGRDIIVYSVFRREDASLEGVATDLGSVAELLRPRVDCLSILCSMFSEKHIVGNVAAMARQG